MFWAESAQILASYNTDNSMIVNGFADFFKNEFHG